MKPEIRCTCDAGNGFCAAVFWTSRWVLRDRKGGSWSIVIMIQESDGTADVS
jgi:hypothetical protein